MVCGEDGTCGQGEVDQASRPFSRAAAGFILGGKRAEGGRGKYEGGKDTVEDEDRAGRQRLCKGERRYSFVAVGSPPVTSSPPFQHRERHVLHQPLRRPVRHTRLHRKVDHDMN